MKTTRIVKREMENERLQEIQIIIKFENAENDWKLETIRNNRTNNELLEYGLNYLNKSSSPYRTKTISEMIIIEW